MKALRAGLTLPPFGSRTYHPPTAKRKQAGDDDNHQQCHHPGLPGPVVRWLPVVEGSKAPWMTAFQVACRSTGGQIPLQLVQDALGRLDEQVRCARMHVEQQEDGQEHEHDKDG